MRASAELLGDWYERAVDASERRWRRVEDWEPRTRSAPGSPLPPRFEVLLSFVSGKLLGPVWFLFSWGCAGFRSSSLGFFSMMFVCGKDLNAGRVHFLVASGAFGCGSWDFAAVGE